MSTKLPANFETIAPTRADIRLASESIPVLSSRKLGKQGSVRIRLGDEEKAVALPASAMRLLLKLLVEMSQGNAVTLLPTQAELTTQQAADLLNVSRPYVVKLIDSGKLPSRVVGKYRRVRFSDVMAYKQRDDAARVKALDALSAEGQEIGLGY